MTPLHSLTAPAGSHVPCEAIRDLLSRGFADLPEASRVLVLIPDHTRSLPLPMLFRMLVEILADRHKAARLDFMVALGTHPPLDEKNLCRLVGITPQERCEKFARIGLLNHAWEDPSALACFGVLEADRIRRSPIASS